MNISKDDMYEIKKLQEEVRELADSEENKRRESYWDNSIKIGADTLARKVPIKNKLSFSVDLDRCGYSKVLGFSLVEFLTSPVSYVKNTLKINIFKFKNI